MPLSAGDEVLANDHEYGACLRIWRRTCDRAVARLVIAPIPLPIERHEQFIDALWERVTRRTRLIVVSHVTSPTAIVVPVAEICRRARVAGIAVCIDGPHAPAMIPIDLVALDCDYYTASCHKWLSAPFGSGFLYVHPRAQSGVRPAIVSWGRTPSGEAPSWRDEFHWTGTRDPAAVLSIPAAIDFFESLGPSEFRRRTHASARHAREQISNLTGLPPLMPDTDDWYASMVAVPLPASEAQPLQDALWRNHQIEVPIIDWNGRRLIRVSCHAYTTTNHVDRLVEALQAAGALRVP